MSSLEQKLKQIARQIWLKTLGPAEQKYWNDPPNGPQPPFLTTAWYNFKAMLIRLIIPAIIWLILTTAAVSILLILAVMFLLEVMK